MEKIPEFIANHLFLCSFLVAILLLLLWNIFSGIPGSLELSANEVTRMINRENAYVLDIRSADEFQSGHVVNAVNIVKSTLHEHVDAMKDYKDKTAIICCQYGQQSTRMVRSLRTQGFESFYCLKGGVSAWQSDNLPLIKDKA